jgi:hypothetical protein
MNALNRIIAFLIFLIAFIALVFLAIAPFQALTWLGSQLEEMNRWAMAYQSDNPLFFTLGRVALGAIAFLIVIPLMLAELPRGKKEKTVKLKTEQGEVQVTAESIAKRLAWHLDQLADVMDVSPTVEPRGDKVHVVLDVETSPEIDVPMKTEEIMLVTREVIEKDMGLKLGKLRVNIRHASYPQLV